MSSDTPARTRTINSQNRPPKLKKHNAGNGNTRRLACIPKWSRHFAWETVNDPWLAQYCLKDDHRSCRLWRIVRTERPSCRCVLTECTLLELEPRKSSSSKVSHERLKGSQKPPSTSLGEIVATAAGKEITIDARANNAIVCRAFEKKPRTF